MDRTTRWHAGLALLLMMMALVFGSLAALAFVFPALGEALSFRQLRPIHVSAALFWIITGATAVVLRAGVVEFGEQPASRPYTAFLWIWTTTIVAVFTAYAFDAYGGREYWEFPPWLNLPLLIAWLCLMAAYFRMWLERRRDPPLYVWMWTTGIVFFLITFLEQNLYHVPWFRDHYLREITVQWKSNGAMVGAWNQMIYGTALFMMVRLTGDEGIARGTKVFLFWLLGLSNLMFNWGHHLYNAPTAGWIRHVAYAISMAEWLILINIIRGSKAKMSEQRKLGHLLTYRFLALAELWVFLNLFLALLMSVPAINRYTHGTHITVAHAMGTTIGINTMLLLGAIGYLLRIDDAGAVMKRWVALGRQVAAWSLLVFWSALIAAGLLKGYRDVVIGITDFQRMMAPVMDVLTVFAIAGVGLLAGLGPVALAYFVRIVRMPEPAQKE